MRVGIDFGGTKILGAGVHALHDSLSIQRFDTPQDVEAGIELFREIIHQASRGQRVQGIGISAPGPIDRKHGTISPLNLPLWREIPLQTRLAEEFQCPVRIEVDTDAAALAEYAFGPDKPSRLFYITLSTGIGGGLLLDGEIFRGAAERHPEIGHQVIDNAIGETLECACGSKNCFEALASGTAIRKRYGKDAKDLAVDEWLSVARIVGKGLRNIAHHYAPDVMVIGGGVAVYAPEIFHSAVADYLRSNVRIIPCPKYMLSVLGYETSLRGALYLAFHC